MDAPPTPRGDVGEEPSTIKRLLNWTTQYLARKGFESPGLDAQVLLAHALNMEVVAERVTGLEQLRRLRAAGCDLVQGHLVGKPCPPEALVVHMDL